MVRKNLFAPGSSSTTILMNLLLHPKKFKRSSIALRTISKNRFYHMRPHEIPRADSYKYCMVFAFLKDEGWSVSSTAVGVSAKRTRDIQINGRNLLEKCRNRGRKSSYRFQNCRKTLQSVSYNVEIKK